MFYVFFVLCYLCSLLSLCSFFPVFSPLSSVSMTSQFSPFVHFSLYSLFSLFSSVCFFCPCSLFYFFPLFTLFLVQNRSSWKGQKASLLHQKYALARAKQRLLPSRVRSMFSPPQNRTTIARDGKNSAAVTFLSMHVAFNTVCVWNEILGGTKKKDRTG